MTLAGTVRRGSGRGSTVLMTVPAAQSVRMLRRWVAMGTVAALLSLATVACSHADHPSGWKPIDYHGVRTFVPADWPVVGTMNPCPVPVGLTGQKAEVVLGEAPRAIGCALALIGNPPP